MVFLFIFALFVIVEYLFEFSVKFFAACNSAGEDGAVGGEENLVWNPRYSIDAHGLGLPDKKWRQWMSVG